MSTVRVQHYNTGVKTPSKLVQQKSQTIGEIKEDSYG